MSHVFSRRLSATVLSLSIFAAVHGQKKYVVNGEIASVKDGMVRLSVYSEQLNDSAIIKDGKFHLEGRLKRPAKAYINIAPARKPSAVIGSVVEMSDGQGFYLSEGLTTIKGKNLESANINNPVQKDYVELEGLKKPYMDRMNKLRSLIYFSKDKDSIRDMDTEVRSLMGPIFHADLSFVKQHPDSYVSLDVVNDHCIVVDKAAETQVMFDALSPAFRNSPEGLKMADQIAVARHVEIGQPAIQFTQNDVNGAPLSLSSLKGKYVLVDFWASWCGPCKLEYPYLHKAYDRFKDKNFEILGVSLDSKKEAWTKSIADNNFTWLLVCDLKGFKNEAALSYGVHAIPQSFLVSPDGIIIAKDLRGNDLLEKLEDVLK